jgi:hypothetical protein
LSPALESPRNVDKNTGGYMNQEASRSQFISHPLESSHQERKRIFTPSRTVFSSVQQVN